MHSSGTILLDGKGFKNESAFLSGDGICYVSAADAVPENVEALLAELAGAKPPAVATDGVSCWIDADSLYRCAPASLLSMHGFFTNRAFLDLCAGRPIVAALVFDASRGEHPSQALESLTDRDWETIARLERLAHSKRKPDPAQVANAAREIARGIACRQDRTRKGFSR